MNGHEANTTSNPVAREFVVGRRNVVCADLKTRMRTVWQVVDPSSVAGQSEVLFEVASASRGLASRAANSAMEN